jgi:hypothetical protein
MFDELRHHQDRVRAIVDRIDTILRADRRDTVALAQARWTLTRVLNAYALFKHGRVFDPIIASRDPARAPAARALKEECLRVGDLFRAHVLRWSAADVGAEWDGYRHDTLALIARLRSHLDRERAAVLALQHGRAPMGTPPPRYGAAARHA